MEDYGFLMNPLLSLEKLNENLLSLGFKFYLNDEKYFSKYTEVTL